MRRILAGIVMGGACLAALPAHAWKIDHGRSSVAFSYDENGVSKSGVFGKFDATISIDDADLARSMASVSVSTSSLDLGDILREGVLETDPWLASEKYPTASFRLISLQPVPGSPGMFEAQGDVLIKGISQPVRFPVNLMDNGREARASGEFSFDRTDFKLRDVVLETFVSIGSRIVMTFDIVALREQSDGQSAVKR